MVRHKPNPKPASWGGFLHDAASTLTSRVARHILLDKRCKGPANRYHLWGEAVRQQEEHFVRRYEPGPGRNARVRHCVGWNEPL